MNRLSLQDLRNLLIKKGRLLYGAVFLFCLVCFYGISTAQWQRVTDLSESNANGAREDISNKSHVDDGASYGPNKGTRGGTVSAYNAKGQNGVGQAQFTNGKGTNGSSQGETKDQFIAPVIGLAKALRAQPFDDSFTHALLTEDMTAVPLGANVIPKERSSATGGRDGHAYGNQQTNLSGIRTIREQRSSYSSNSYNRVNNGYTTKGRVTINSLESVHLTGLIGGSTNLALLRTDNGEACYAVGEGPQGILVQAITSEAVLISDGVKSRWLYME
ncbi:hypothetical protein [Veillonella sp. R32]|uniref:hypothetical protein n=1 Tax=Veillonella sp. R32 TaxID=2021312 RepID=UPI001389DF9A|nr:hypothetical protein [Veillonella sp. R32]KAF1682872.1 hypothetical protein VER_04145 [Veillonella sp. R32]